MNEFPEFTLKEVLIGFGSLVFWANVAYWGVIRRIEKKDEMRDKQRVSNIGDLVASVPKEYKRMLPYALREAQRDRDADLSGLVSNFPSEYRTNVAIALNEAGRIGNRWILEEHLANEGYNKGCS